MSWGLPMKCRSRSSKDLGSMERARSWSTSIFGICSSARATANSMRSRLLSESACLLSKASSSCLICPVSFAYWPEARGRSPTN